MKCLVIKKNGEESLDLSSNVFEVAYNESLVHQLVVFYLSNSHKRIKKHKGRGEVRGGGKKPWNQKGSGRARVGSIRSPLWRGGGKIFAANSCVSVKKKLNKKMYKLGMKVIFSELFRSNRINIIDNIVISGYKTKVFLNEISYLNIVKTALFVINDFNLNIDLSTRNLKYMNVISFKNINPIILLKFKSIYITEDAIKNIEECFK